MSKNRPIKIKVKDTFEVWENGVFEAKVSAHGNGGAIPFYKRYIGDEVIIILRDKIKEAENVISTEPETQKKMAHKYFKKGL